MPWTGSSNPAAPPHHYWLYLPFCEAFWRCLRPRADSQHWTCDAVSQTASTGCAPAWNCSPHKASSSAKDAHWDPNDSPFLVYCCPWCENLGRLWVSKSLESVLIRLFARSSPQYEPLSHFLTFCGQQWPLVAFGGKAPRQHFPPTTSECNSHLQIRFLPKPLPPPNQPMWKSWPSCRIVRQGPDGTILLPNQSVTEWQTSISHTDFASAIFGLFPRCQACQFGIPKRSVWNFQGPKCVDQNCDVVLATSALDLPRWPNELQSYSTASLGWILLSLRASCPHFDH